MMGCLSGTRSDKQIERKILHVYIVYMDLFFFPNPALFESPRGDRIYCLCTVRKSRKGMPQAVKSIRLGNTGCGLFMQKGSGIGKIGPFPPTSLHEWLVELQHNV